MNGEANLWADIINGYCVAYKVDISDCIDISKSIERNALHNTLQQPFKLKWIGTPAQFGFFIQELIGKGYLAKPTKSYAKDAEVYLSCFEISAKQSTIEKEISPADAQNSLSPTNRSKFKIPPKDSLK
jgi:hypothetical protein